MSSLKSGLEIDTSQLVDGPTETANATDVTTPLGDLLAHVKNGLLSVSANDTHVKTLDEALTISGSGISKAEQSDGGDESLQLSLASKLEQLLALLVTGGKVPATAMDSTGASNGDVLTANGSGGASFAASGGGGAQPIDLTATAGEDLALRDMVFLNEGDGEWYKIDIDADPIQCGPLRGCVNEAGGITENNTGSVRILGEVDGFTGLTAWSRVWAHSTAGGYTQTKPEPSLGGAQVAVAEMGYATATTTIFVQPRPVQYMKADTLADDATMTVKHHTDAQGRERDLRVYLASTTAGSSIESYADSNQDFDVRLRDQIITSYGSDQCTGGTVSSSSEDSPDVDDRAFDDDTGNYWKSNGLPDTTPQYIQYTFGATITTRQYTLRSDLAVSAPDEFELQYHDGADWQTADSQSSVSWSDNETKTFNVSAEYSSTQWRIYITSTQGGGNKVRIAEIEMKDAATYTNTKDKLAQSFQLDSGDDVVSIKLWLKKIGSPTGNLTVKIQTDNSGDPSGTTITNGTSNTVAASTLSASYDDIEFTFSTPPTLAGSTTYWIVLETTDSADEFDYVAWGADNSAPSYANGEGKGEVSSSWGAESVDFIFDVLGVGVQYDSPALIDDWETALNVFAARYDDGSGSNSDTQTTVKNVTGVSKDVISIVELR